MTIINNNIFYYGMVIFVVNFPMKWLLSFMVIVCFLVCKYNYYDYGKWSKYL